MNPFKALVTALATFAQDFRAKMNPALEALPKLESIEAAEPVLSVLRMVKWAQKDAEDLASQFDGKIANVEDMINAYNAKIAEEAVTAAVTAGTLIKKEDHENAITAAKDAAATEAKTQAEQEFNAKVQKIETLATRRKEAVTKLGEIAAAKLTDEQLSADNYVEAITAKEALIAKLKEENIVPEGDRKAMFESLVAKEGVESEDFKSSLSIILTAAGGKLKPLTATAPTPPAPAPGSAAGLSAGKQGGKKEVVC